MIFLYVEKNKIPVKVIEYIKKNKLVAKILDYRRNKYERINKSRNK